MRQADDDGCEMGSIQSVSKRQNLGGCIELTSSMQMYICPLVLMSREVFT